MRAALDAANRVLQDLQRRRAPLVNFSGTARRATPRFAAKQRLARTCVKRPQGLGLIERECGPRLGIGAVIDDRFQQFYPGRVDVARGEIVAHGFTALTGKLSE